jgi:two-component system, OmpR family, sensor histidine kinase BaeS
VKVRNKIFTAIAALVLFMTAVFYALSNNYLGALFRKYAEAAQQGTAEPWARSLAYYYVRNGNSWDGVNIYIAEIFRQTGARHGNDVPEFEHLAVVDSDNHVVAEYGSADNPLVGTGSAVQDIEVPIVVNGETVGTLFIRDRGIEGLYQIENTVLHSMALATFWGALITALIALVVGAWMSRRITRPLKQMIQAIGQTAQGDLQTRLEIRSNDEFGEVARAFNDMTDRLSRTEEARRHLVADVAHELRIPLTVIRGQLELIQEGVKPAEPATLLPIQDEVMRLSRLVQDLHQLSLAEVGKLPLEKKATNMLRFLERIRDNFEVESEDKQVCITITSSVPEAETVVSVDPDRITQVFVNLLGNALRYSPPGSEIAIRLEQNTDYLVVSVSDMGPGIAEEHIPFIFNRFYRADEDRSRESGGTGIGLAIAKEFVEAHGGKIEVQSTVGKGTCFLVYLPYQKAATPGA